MAIAKKKGAKSVSKGSTKKTATVVKKTASKVAPVSKKSSVSVIKEKKKTSSTVQSVLNPKSFSLRLFELLMKESDPGSLLSVWEKNTRKEVSFSQLYFLAAPDEHSNQLSRIHNKESLSVATESIEVSAVSWDSSESIHGSHPLAKMISRESTDPKAYLWIPLLQQQRAGILLERDEVFLRKEIDLLSAAALHLSAPLLSALLTSSRLLSRAEAGELQNRISLQKKELDGKENSAKELHLKVKELNEELQRSRERIGHLKEKEEERHERESEHHKKDLSAQKEKYSILESEYRTLQDRNETLQRQYDEMKSCKDVAEAELAVKTEEFNAEQGRFSNERGTLLQKITGLENNLAESKAVFEKLVRDFQETQQKTHDQANTIQSLREEKESSESLYEEELQNLKQRWNAQESEYQNTVDQLKREHEVLTSSVSEKSERITALESEAAHLQNELNTRTSDLDYHAEELKRLQGEEAKAHQLEQRLEEAREEMQKATALFEEEIETLRGQRDALDQKLQVVVSENEEHIRELNTRIGLLNSDQSALQKNLETERNTFATTLKEKQDALDNLELSLMESEDRYGKEMQVLQDRITTLHQKNDHLSEELEKEKEGRVQDIQSKDERITTLQLERDRIIKDFEKEKDGILTSLKQMEADHRNLENERQQTLQQLEREKGESKKWQEKSLQLQNDLESDRAEAKHKLNELQHQMDSVFEKAKEEQGRISGLLAEAESHEKSLREQIRSLEADIQSLQSQLSDSQGQRKELESSLQAASDDRKNLESTIAERDLQLSAFQKEIEAQELRIITLEEHLEDSKKREIAMGLEINSYRENEKLTQERVAELESVLELRKKEMEEQLNRAKDLEHAVDQLSSTVTNLKEDLHDTMKQKESLHEELTRAQSREKGAREEGMLFTGLLETLSIYESFTDKLHYVIQSAPFPSPVVRTVLFSAVDENTLEYHSVIAGDLEWKALLGIHVPLSNTAFGNAFASGHTEYLTRIPDADFPLPEGLDLESLIPDYGQLPYVASYLILPLFDGGRVTGAAVFGMSEAKAPGETALHIFQHLSPLLATALRFDIINNGFSRFNLGMESLKRMNRHIQERYLEFATFTRKLLEGSAQATSEPENGGPGKNLDEIPRLTRIVTLLPEGTIPVKKDEHFIDWVSRLCQTLEETMKLEQMIEIEPEALRRLSVHWDGDLSPLYWITLEAIDNVARHSMARNLKVHLKENRKDIITFSIVDSGEGLLRTAGTEEPKQGKGLVAIRHLTSITDGELRLGRDEKGYGLGLNIEWNLKKQKSGFN